MTNAPSSALQVSLTNVTGMGATQLVRSLLPALERAGPVADIHLPQTGSLARYECFSPGLSARVKERRLPNAASRLVECLLPSRDVAPALPLLVLGDLPLRTDARQTVFIHTPHLLQGALGASMTQRLKFAASRAVMRANLSKVDAAIVQTETMRRGLEAAYPALAGRVHIVAQPAPQWLLGSQLRRTGRTGSGKLRLFYPAAPYPHKNHATLYAAATLPGWREHVDQTVITVPADDDVPTIDAVGRLDPAGMHAAYACVDALVFPSLAESYGLPLVEAMWLGLPVICANLPYARDLCADEAIYFEPRDARSLADGVAELAQRLDAGWWPDWSDRVARLPADWDEVAQRIRAIALAAV